MRFAIMMLIACVLYAGYKVVDRSTLYVVKFPVTDNSYLALSSGDNFYMARLPFAITSKTYTRVW